MLLSGLMAAAWVPATEAPTQGAPPAEVPGQTMQPSSPGTAQAPEVWLRGPFGRVPGGSVDDPATAAPLGLPLDTFVRHAPLVLETGTTIPIERLEIVARPFDDTVPVEILSTAATAFEGPGRPGQSLLVATIGDPVDESDSQYAWLLDVPDREPPVDGLYDIPAPEVIVASDAGTATGVTASGCYAYLCVDTGGLPPSRTLEPLAARVGEVLSLRLSDSSAILAWEGTLSSLGHRKERGRTAFGALTDSAEEVLSLAGLEAPAAGEWLLRLKVVFDRERGWLWTVYRLTVD